MAVYEVGEGEPGSLTKTLHGHGDPRHGRRRGDSLGRRCVGTSKMTPLQGASRCSGVTTSYVYALEGALEAGGLDHRQWRCGPKGRRSGNPMLDR
jgi:hypothetical protein